VRFPPVGGEGRGLCAMHCLLGIVRQTPPCHFTTPRAPPRGRELKIIRLYPFAFHLKMHRYILQPYQGRGSRFVCPECCDNRRTFKRYIDTQTNAYLADHVGKCDRIDHCGYHYPPRDYFASGGSVQGYPNTINHEPQPINYFDTLPFEYLRETERAFKRNNFVAFLVRCFGEDTAYRLAYQYHIGTSKHWPGATIFWQVDVNDKLRTGKIMLYNPADGHRVKQPYNHIAWAHSLVSSKQLSVGSNKANCKQATANFTLQQCFFGEHLLKAHPNKIVAIAESEKTAVICSFFQPDHIWLAAGSLEGLSLEKCKVLKGRRVILFPDTNGYEKWIQKARELNLRIPTATFAVDQILQRNATPEEHAQGIDLADLWIEQIKQMKKWTEN